VLCAVQKNKGVEHVFAVYLKPTLLVHCTAGLPLYLRTYMRVCVTPSCRYLMLLCRNHLLEYCSMFTIFETLLRLSVSQSVVFFSIILVSAESESKI